MSPKMRAEYAQQQRERILDAAYDLFAEQGYQRTTMRRLASRMGMTTGVLYTYFASKDEIIQALAERSRRHSAQLLEVLSQKESMKEALQALFEMLTDHRQQDRLQKGARANINLLSEATSRESLRKEASELYHETATVFMRLAEAAARRREFAAGVEPAAAATLLRALFLGLQTERVLLADADVGKHLSAISNTLLRNVWSSGKESA